MKTFSPPLSEEEDRPTFHSTDKNTSLVYEVLSLWRYVYLGTHTGLAPRVDWLVPLERMV